MANEADNVCEGSCAKNLDFTLKVQENRWKLEECYNVIFIVKK